MRKVGHAKATLAFLTMGKTMGAKQNKECLPRSISLCSPHTERELDCAIGKDKEGRKKQQGANEAVSQVEQKTLCTSPWLLHRARKHGA